MNFSIRGTHNFTSESYTIKAGQLGASPATGPLPATDVKLKSSSDIGGFLSTEAAQPLSQQYRIGLGIQQLELGQELAGQQLRVRRQQTAYDVKQVYYRVLQTRSALNAIEETLTSLRELDQLVERYVREQTALKSDSLEVRTRLAKAEHEALTQVIFGVPDGLLTQLKLGAPLTVTTESLHGTDFAGRVTAISPAADTRSRVFNIEVTVPSPKRELKAGMIASLEVRNGPKVQPVPVAPMGAIVRAPNDPNGYAVFVVEEHNGARVARLRTVEIGDIHGNTIAVTAGLKAGEQIIVTGATLVSEGEGVRIIP